MNKEMIKLELPQEMFNIVILSLQKQPYEIVAGVMAEIQKQLTEIKPQ